MQRTMRVAALAVAMGWCAPAAAQGFDQKSPKTLEQQVNEKCSGKRGPQRETCAARIKESYQRFLERNANRKH